MSILHTSPFIERVKFWLVLSLFAAILIFYIIFYAPYGLENNDSGFILGVSWQLFGGQQLYKDIVYVRPPVTPFLHSVALFFDAPVFVSRIIFYTQVATYNLLTAILLADYFKSKSISYLIGIFGFFFSVHNFPAMPWHTVDGIFFSVLALWLLSFSGRLWLIGAFLAGISILAAMLCKQSFYLLPIAIIFYLALANQVLKACVIFVTVFCFLVFFYYALYSNDMLDLYLSMVSGQTGIYELIDIGFSQYFSDFLKHLPYILFMSMVLLLVSRKGTKSSTFFMAFCLVCAWMIYKFLSKDGYYSIVGFIDSLFVLSLAYCTYMLLVRISSLYLLLFIMHFVAWSSSISWGYQSIALYSTPIFFALAIICFSSDVEARRVQRLPVFLALFISIYTFYLGSVVPYNLERSVSRERMTFKMGDVFPGLEYIYSDQDSFNMYKELKELHREYGNNFTVLPSMPLANMLTKTVNPIGVDWVMNAEINNKADYIINRLEERQPIVFLVKDPKPSPYDSGRYGFEVYQYVEDEWSLLADYNYFMVFKYVDL